MIKTLAKIGEKLNSENIIWGVGGSMLLSFYGLIKNPNDIDIVVSLDDITVAEKVLDSIGSKTIIPESSNYSTEYFYKYIVDKVKLDVMSGFKLNFYNGFYEYRFDKSSTSDTRKISGADIPLCALEDWYILYQLIPNKEYKASIIEEHLITNGIKNKCILEEVAKSNLPKNAKERIFKLLEK